MVMGCVADQIFRRAPVSVLLYHPGWGPGLRLSADTRAFYRLVRERVDWLGI